MAKGSDPKPDEKKAAEKKAADEAAAAKLAAEEAAKKKAAGGDDDDDDEGKSKSKEKTYTAAELKAANDKAVADALKKADDEKELSDLEKANKRIAELEADRRLTSAKEETIAALTKEGAQSPELLWKTMKGDLEFDDAGKLKNLDTLVTSLKSDYTEMFGEKKPEGGADGGKGQKGEEGTLTKEKLEKMSPAAINELDWKDVSKVMAAD